MKANQKIWGCPKKQAARRETIIAPYQTYFSHNLPKNKQYWTMCGQCATRHGEPALGCEIDQLVKEKLILPKQFRGVEISKGIHDLNVKAYPEIKFYNGDFYDIMNKEYNKDQFNPGIVNIDYNLSVDSAADDFSRIMVLLNSVCDEVLVIANFILGLEYRGYTLKNSNYVINLLNTKPQFKQAIRNNDWWFPKLYYPYLGTGKNSATDMGSFIFAKNPPIKF